MKKYLLFMLLCCMSVTIAADDFVYRVGDDNPSSRKRKSSVVISDGDEAIYIEEYTATPKTESSKQTKTHIKDFLRQAKVSKNEVDLTVTDDNLVYYSGMVDIGFGESLGNGFLASVSTTHGVQASKWFFIGLGVGYMYEKNGTRLPVYDEPYAEYIPYEYEGEFEVYDSGHWESGTKQLGGHSTGCHSFNYFLDMRAYFSKGKWVVPYFDCKFGAITSLHYESGDWAEKEFTYGDLTHTVEYRAYPNIISQTNFYYELGLGLVIAQYLDVRFACSPNSVFADAGLPVNLQAKIGVRF